MVHESRKRRGLRGSLALVAGLFVAGCGAGEAPEASSDETGAAEAPTLTYGDPTPLGNGTIRTYVVAGPDGPVELGVALSETALDGLPADGAEGGVLMPDGHSTFQMALGLPAENPTPFVHVMVDWNPAGHEPAGVYNLPHLDFHFYTVGPDAVMAIDPADPDFMAKAQNAPPATHLPAGYVVPEGLLPVPFMGTHWVDPNSPELRMENPATFTHTFIYGSWDGALTFVEPMITVDFLRSREPLNQPVAVAEAYDPAGYYPTSYSVGFDQEAGEYRVALSGLSMME